MPVPVLAAAGAVAAIVFIIVCLQVLESRRLTARREAFTREAAQRGWRYASMMEAGTRTDRFEGTGLAGRWTAEVIERRGRKRPGVRLMRWWNAGADAPPPASGPVVLLVALDAEQRLPDEEPPQGVLANMVARAIQMALTWGISFRFGALLPAGQGELRLVRTAPSVDGFAVLSTQPDEARRRMTSALVDALGRAFPPGAWDTRRARRPWLGLAGDRVAIACMSETVPQAADVAALIEAGSTVAACRL